MRMLRITGCRDPLMWYAGLVGEMVPYLGRWPEAYKSREPAGYINRVEFADAEMVDIRENTMKMAKASKADMEMALKLCSALEAIDRRFFPEGSEGDDERDDFDLDDDEHCGTVLRHIYYILQGGSIGRVIWGMYVLMDPTNKVIDPDASTLEPHPEIEAANTDAQRYRLLRRGQCWSVIDGIGDTLRADALDAAIDAAMAASMPANDQHNRTPGQGVPG